jgi:hypothetical protein
MNRSEINFKSVVIGEGSTFDESFSLVLDKGRGSYNFLFRFEGCEKTSELNSFVSALNGSFKEQFVKKGDLFERFESGVMKVNQMFQELMADMELEFRISAVLMAEGNGQIVMTKAGDGEVYLVRENGFMNVGDAVEVDDSSDELFDNVVSGSLEVKDRYILTTTRVLRYVSESQMVRESGRLGFEDFAKWLIDKLEFELEDKVIVDFFECKDLVYEREIVVDKVDKGVYWRNFKRNFGMVFRSVLSGDIKSIDLDLRRRIVGVTLGLLVLFVVSSLWLAHRSVVNAELDRYRDELDVAQLIINNAKSEFDKDTIGKMLQNAEAKIKVVRGVDSLEDEAEILEEQVREIKSKIDNVVTVEPKLVQNVIGPAEVNYSLQSVYSDGVNLRAVTENRMYHYLSDIEKDPITFDPGEGVEDYVWDLEDGVLYVITKAGNALRIDDSLVKTLKVEGEGVKLGDGTSFYLDKFYTLDSENRQIWKESIGRESVGIPTTYLVDGYGKFVDSAVDIAIDGYVYVVTEGGDIFRFLRGELDDQFEVYSKPMLPLLNPDKIYAELDVPYIFVLEKSENRIVQFYNHVSQDRLEYVRQYYFPELDEIRDFDIDYLEEKIYLIDSRSIYSTDLDTTRGL